MTQGSSHLVNKLAYILFSRKFKVISKTISNNFRIHQIPQTKIAYQVLNSRYQKKLHQTYSEMLHYTLGGKDRQS